MIISLVSFLLLIALKLKFQMQLFIYWSIYYLHLNIHLHIDIDQLIINQLFPALNYQCYISFFLIHNWFTSFEKVNVLPKKIGLVCLHVFWEIMYRDVSIYYMFTGFMKCLPDIDQRQFMLLLLTENKTQKWLFYLKCKTNQLNNCSMFFLLIR